MIECPACGRRLRPGTLFCSECGVYLSSGESLLTGPLPTDPLPEIAASGISSGVFMAGELEGAELPPAATALCVTIARSGRQELFPLPIDEIWLGRADAAHGVSPDLDLASDGGFEEGVSRQHARIYQEDNYIFIEDAASTNGTFLNHRRLIPHLPYPLREGDTLRLGRLQLLLRFDSER